MTSLVIDLCLVVPLFFPIFARHLGVEGGGHWALLETAKL